MFEPPVMFLPVPKRYKVLPAGVTVPDKITLPVELALESKVIVPERVKFSKGATAARFFVVPLITHVLPLVATKVPFVKFAFPETVQVLLPVVRTSLPPPVPIKSKSPPTVTAALGPARIALPVLLALTKRLAVPERVTAPAIVTVLLDALLLYASTFPEYDNAGMVQSPAVASSRMFEDKVPVEGTLEQAYEALPNVVVPLPRDALARVPKRVIVVVAIRFMPDPTVSVAPDSIVEVETVRSEVARVYDAEPLSHKLCRVALPPTRFFEAPVSFTADPPVSDPASVRFPAIGIAS